MLFFERKKNPIKRPSVHTVPLLSLTHVLKFQWSPQRPSSTGCYHRWRCRCNLSFNGALNGLPARVVISVGVVGVTSTEGATTNCCSTDSVDSVGWFGFLDTAGGFGLGGSAWVAFEVETRTRIDFFLQFRRPRGPVFPFLIMDHLFLCMSMTSRWQHVSSVSSMLGDPMICSQHPGLR